MAYLTDPNTVVAAHVNAKGTAALCNNWKAGQDFLHDPSNVAGGLAYRTTDQTITGTQTINFTAEYFDVGTVHDNVTNNERITIPSGADGLYLVALNMRCTLATGSWPEFTVRIRKNGTTTLAKKTRRAGGDTASASLPLACCCAWLGPLVATDYLTATVLNGTAADADVGSLVSLAATWLCRGVT